MKNTDSLGRRSFVRGTLAAIAAGAATASAAAIAVSALPELIATRKRCHEAYLCAEAEEAVLIKAFEATPSPLVPIEINAEGKVEERLELRLYNPEFITGEIEEIHFLDVEWSHRSKAICLGALKQAIAEDAELERGYGIEAAQDRSMEAAAALQAATLAILRHAPISAADGELKAEWLVAELASRPRRWSLNFDEMQALIASIADGGRQA